MYIASLLLSAETTMRRTIEERLEVKKRKSHVSVRDALDPKRIVFFMSRERLKVFYRENYTFRFFDFRSSNQNKN